MYEDIGKKIKSLAQTMFGVAATLEVIVGIVLWAADEGFAILGALLLFIAPIISWISSWMLYGFGELIDKTCDIERKMGETKKDPETPTSNDSERIKKIESLRSQGLITDEEYQAKRAEIISQL